MDKFPTIETQRLLLTELQATDVAEIVTYAGNRSVSEYTVNIPFPYSEKDAIYWINSAHQGFDNRTQFIFAIRLREKIQFIGGIGITVTPRNLRAEIGYWIAEPFWNNGFMTEAAKAIIDFGFATLGLNKLMATHLETNEASGKVMLKCGMSKEGNLQEQILKNSVFHNLIVYGLTRSAYEKQRN